MSAISRENAKDHTVPQPYWCHLRESWSRVARCRDIPDCAPRYLPRTAYTHALQTITQAALSLLNADASLTEAAETIETHFVRYDVTGTVLEWMKAGHQIMAELEGARRAASMLGLFAAARAVGDTDPLHRAALNLVETLSAVVIDSLADFPNSIANALSHSAVTEARQKLSEAICEAQAASDTNDSENLTEGFRTILGRICPDVR